jgi:adenylate cyclase
VSNRSGAGRRRQAQPEDDGGAARARARDREAGRDEARDGDRDGPRGAGRRDDAPDGGPAASAEDVRRGLVEDLLAQGHAPDEIRAAERAQRLALLPVQRILRGDPTMTTSDVVARTGVDPELFERVLQASGVPIPAAHDAVWEERDLGLPLMLRELADLGVDDAALVELSRTLGDYAARIGSAAIIGLGSGLTREGDTERELSRRIAAAADPVATHMADTLGMLVRATALDQLAAVELDADVIADGRLAGATPVAIGFADVVGFTRMGEQLGAQRLRDVAARLGELAGEVTGDGVRVIKTIGDAVMLAGPRPLAVVEALLALQERVAAEPDFPRIRSGVATGDAVPRAGDWFGPPVNRASRVCAAARPDSLLVDEPTYERIAGADLELTPIGRVRLKGVGRMPLHRARPGDDGRWRAGVHPGTA